MKRIFFTTIISSIGVMVLYSIYGTIIRREIEIFPYLLILGTENIIIPIFIAVIIDRTISHFLKLKRVWKKLLIRMILLGIIMLIGLWTWAIIDVIGYYESFKEVTYERIVEDFYSEYFDWLPIVFMLMISIPIIDSVIKRKFNNRESK